MENIVIRNVKEEDIFSIADIQVNAWKIAYRNIIDTDYLDNLSKEEKIKKHQKNYKKANFIVAELNNEIVGFCRYIDNGSYTPELSNIDCELLALYVKPELKNNGIGMKLIRYVKKEFLKKNKSKMILWCLKENEPSKKFYEKANGKIIAERAIKIGDRYYQEVGFLFNLLAENCEIRKIEKSNYPEALDLVWKTFLKFEAPGYSQEGIDEFYNSINNDDFLKELAIYGAYLNNNLVGVIATRNLTHIALLFVYENYQNKGIGEKLFKEMCLYNKESYFTVNSSPYGMFFYKKLGFKETDKEQEISGIRFIPMKKVF